MDEEFGGFGFGNMGGFGSFGGFPSSNNFKKQSQTTGKQKF